MIPRIWCWSAHVLGSPFACVTPPCTFLGISLLFLADPPWSQRSVGSAGLHNGSESYKSQVRVYRQPGQEFVVPLRKEIRGSLTRQGMQDIKGLQRKRLAERMALKAMQACTLECTHAHSPTRLRSRNKVLAICMLVRMHACSPCAGAVQPSASKLKHPSHPGCAHMPGVHT